MPGSQLVNRLQDLNYRVEAILEPDVLLAFAQTEGPMLIFADLDLPDTPNTIARLRADPKTSHIPSVVFGGEDERLWQAAQTAGATLVVGETALLAHLPSLLDQALRIE